MVEVKQYITKGSDYYYSRLIRNASVAVALKLKGVKIAPEQIVLLGVLPAIAALLLYAQGGYPSVAWGSFCYALAWFMDFVDGDFARITNRVSERGEWLDSVSGRFVEMLVYSGVCLGLARRHDPVAVWVIGFTVVSLHHLIVSIMSKETIIALKANKADAHAHTDVFQKKKKIGLVKVIVRELTAGPDMNGFIIILGGLTDRLYWALVLCVVYNMCYLVLRLFNKSKEYFFA